MNGDERAFPSSNDVEFGGLATHGHAGMTLRDYLAARAMQGLIASKYARINNTQLTLERTAYEHADAMMMARERR